MPRPFLMSAWLLAAMAPAGAAELGFAHFAPGAGTVLIEAGAGTHVLDYKGYEGVVSHPAGTVHVSALGADGTLLTEGEFPLRQNDRYVVILAGNGSAQAPWQFRLATDHNFAFTGRQWSVQDVSLAIPPVADATSFTPPPVIVVQDSCRGVGLSAGTPESFGYGTRTLSDTDASGVSVREVGQTCVQTAGTAGIEPALDEVAITGRPGERLRRFLTGDGVNAPYEMVVLSQGIDPVLPVMTPDASIEGLFSIVGQPNTGVQVVYDGSAPEGERVSAVYFGFENDGRASWRTLEKTHVIEYVGGNREGTRAAVGFDRARALITAHNCNELTILVAMQSGPTDSHIFPAGPRNTLYLKRLFPPVCPPSVPTGQEEKP